jgi:hypothetical protein
LIWRYIVLERNLGIRPSSQNQELLYFFKVINGTGLDL